MYPAIHLTDTDFFRWVRNEKKNMKQICLEIERLSNAIKKAIDYPWVNNQILIDNIYGKATIQINANPYDGAITLWAYKNGVFIGSYLDAKLFERELKTILDKLTAGSTQCNECKKWVKDVAIIQYSFTGGVCPNCYDPKKHLPPDTSGD